jgi:hypothetical protein
VLASLANSIVDAEMSKKLERALAAGNMLHYVAQVDVQSNQVSRLVPPGPMQEGRRAASVRRRSSFVRR